MQGKVLFGGLGLVVGLLVGFLAANTLNRQALITAPPSPTDTVFSGAPGSAAAPGGTQVDVAQTLQKATSETNNFIAQMQAGDMYAQIGRFDKAIEFYSRGVELNPANTQAHVVLANAYFDSQRFADAERHYAKVLELDPKNVNARTDLGATFVERPQPDLNRAISEFRSALEIDPKSLPTIYYLGIAHLRKGDRGEAEKMLAELEKIGPQSELVSRLRQNLNGNPPIR